MAQPKKQKLIVIVGPTASGKSALAVMIARQVNGEIISADSRQVYRGLDVGTGKITKKEMRGVPHHLLDIASPSRGMSVSQFQKKAVKAIQEITKRGKIPILCGGTGLYIDAVAKGIVFPEVKPDAKLRKKLEKLSTEKLFTLLKEIDPKRAKNIDKKNPRRLIRAIEIAKSLGKVPNLETRRPSKYDTLYIGIKIDEERIREKIRARLKERLKRGMIAEAKRLHKNGLSFRRMEALGLEYRYLSQYLKGGVTKKEMEEELNVKIYQYAKRQITWFKKNKEIHWMSVPKDKPKIKKEIRQFLSKK